MAKNKYSFSYLAQGCLKKISPLIKDDKFYLSLRHRIAFSKKMDWENPLSYNEKMQWLKLYDRNPIYTIMADKFLVKEYVANLIGEEHVVPLIGVWDNPEDIDWDALPDKFAMKCNHNSGGGMIICKDKSKLQISKAMEGLRKGLKDDYYLRSREWPYRNIPRKIIAEKFMDDGRKGELQDYKIWCFNGVPTYMYVSNKGGRIYENFYDMDFNVADINHGSDRYEPEYKKPAQFEEMKQLATKLSQGLPFVRVDFFIVCGTVYFAEFTFYDWGGFRPFSDYVTDLKIGNFITLPEKRIK
ncbi:MAG: glycosyl transferase [Mediterranea massiliensis]|nr:glycosyl transferase [Mediterranea massiliensis]